MYITMVFMRMPFQPLATAYGGIGDGDRAGTMDGMEATDGIAGRSDGIGAGAPLGGGGTLHHGDGTDRTIIGEEAGTPLRYALTDLYGLIIR